MKTVIRFTAGWCQPCKMYAPIFDSVKAKDNSAEFSVVDVDANRELARKYAISSIPTTVVEVDGVVKNRYTGVMSESQLVNFIKD